MEVPVANRFDRTPSMKGRADKRQGAPPAQTLAVTKGTGATVTLDTFLVTGETRPSRCWIAGPPRPHMDIDDMVDQPGEGTSTHGPKVNAIGVEPLRMRDGRCAPVDHADARPTMPSSTRPNRLIIGTLPRARNLQGHEVDMAAWSRCPHDGIAGRAKEYPIRAQVHDDVHRQAWTEILQHCRTGRCLSTLDRVNGEPRALQRPRSPQHHRVANGQAPPRDGFSRLSSWHEGNGQRHRDEAEASTPPRDQPHPQRLGRPRHAFMLGRYRQGFATVP